MYLSVVLVVHQSVAPERVVLGEACKERRWVGFTVQGSGLRV